MRSVQSKITVGALAAILFVCSWMQEKELSPVVDASPVDINSRESLSEVVSPRQEERPPLTKALFFYEDFAKIIETIPRKGETPELLGDLTRLSSEEKLLWKEGKIGVPDHPWYGVGFAEDFNGDGILDRAVPVKTTNGNYIVLVLGSQEGWKFFLFWNPVGSKEQLRNSEFIRDKVQWALELQIPRE